MKSPRGARERSTELLRPFSAIYHWYSRHILPRIGSAISGHSAAYTYLPESMKTFPYGAEFVRILTTAGFSQVEARPLMFGAVYLYMGQKRKVAKTYGSAVF